MTHSKPCKLGHVVVFVSTLVLLQALDMGVGCCILTMYHKWHTSVGHALHHTIGSSDADKVVWVWEYFVGK